MSEARKDVVPNLAAAGLLIAAALAATAARQAGWIDGDTVTRIVMAGTGLMLAWVGNRMPKAWVPQAAARRVNRVAGWSQAISGLVYGGLWAFAPFDVAVWGGGGAIVLGIAVTVGYCATQVRRGAA